MGKQADYYAVENCLDLSVFRLNKAGLLSGIRKGTLPWKFYNGYVFNLNVTTDTANGFIRLQYEIGRSYDTDYEIKTMDYKVRLSESYPHYGGKRYWLECPLMHCKTSRSGKLYLPPFRDWFGCRKCYGLQYESSRKSGSWGSKLNKLFDKLEYGDDSAYDEAVRMLQ